MATVTAFLKHSHISKQGQAQPYTAAAHARYVMRQNAVQLVYSEHMPKQYHAVQRFLQQHEDGLRKNGRVMDKFIISIPHDVSQDDAVKALRKFGHRLGHGKAPFLFAIHGFDTRNHHAHFLFIDRDPETGRRVFGTSERNSSASIKIEWETAANETFAQLGYDVRVKVSEGYQEEVANDNAPISPDMPVADSEGEDEEMVTETVSEEADMADIHAVIPRPHEADISSAADRVRHIHSTVTELNALRDARIRMEEAQARLDFLLGEKSRTEAAAVTHASAAMEIRNRAAAAQTHLSQYQRGNGKLKGIGIRLFGFEYKTQTRQLAEKASQEASDRMDEAAQAAREQRSYEVRIQQLDRDAKRAAEEALLRHNELIGVNGSMGDVDAAEEVHLNSIQAAIDGEDGEHALDAAEAWSAWEAGEVTDDELRTYLIHSGNRQLLAELDEALSEGGQSL